MKKQRLLVMNGQKIVQTEEGPNDWRVEKVEKAQGIRPGYYNLYTARTADKSATTDGIILHVDAQSIYQHSGKEVVLHAKQDFDKVPDMGSAASICYKEGRAVVSVPQQQKAQKLSR